MRAAGGGFGVTQSVQEGLAAAEPSTLHSGKVPEPIGGALVPSEIIVVDVGKAAEAFRFFEEFKQRLLKPEDYVVIQGKNHIKKSGWRKYQLACNVSDEIVHHKRVPVEGRDAEGHFQHEFWVRAFHKPTGRSVVGVAIASSAEKKAWSHKEHDVFSLGHTRAKNRAISDLVGGGEVSAEEILPGEHEETAAQQASSQPQSSSEWHVPVTTDPVNLPMRQYPLQYSQRTVGQVNVDPERSELALVSEKPVSADSRTIQGFLVPRILESIKQKHPEVEYSLCVENGLVKAVLVKTSGGPERIGELMTELMEPAAWAFAKAAEK